MKKVLFILTVKQTIFIRNYDCTTFSTVEVNTLAKINAPRDYPTFAKMFNPKIGNCLFSKRLLDSNAKDDIVVNEPQKPTAMRSEYLASRFHITDNTENTPKIKLPITFTARIFTGKAPNSTGVETNLYLRNAPARAPAVTRISSIPLIFIFHLPFS